jgi:putative ABC transport system substrate-binding protein
MIDRRKVLLVLLAASAPAVAQNRRLRIGWLVFGGSALGPVDKALQDALVERGLIDGRTIDVMYRYADGNPARLPELAKQLVAEKPDLIIAMGGDVMKALFDASGGGVPVVGGISDNPVRAGIAVSLARPGKNFTGVTFITDEMAAKRMELLKEVAPATTRVSVIWNPQHFDDEMVFARRAAESLGIGLNLHPLSSLGDLDAVLRDVGDKGADSIFIIPSRLTNIAADKIALYARERRLPVMAAWREFVDSGALLSYGPSRIFEARRLVGYIEKIRAGEKPANIPIEQPVKFELVVNLKTAKAIGLKIAESFLLRADEVIE